MLLMKRLTYICRNISTKFQNQHASFTESMKTSCGWKENAWLKLNGARKWNFKNEKNLNVKKKR